jgi:hypothetical protein
MILNSHRVSTSMVNKIGIQTIFMRMYLVVANQEVRGSIDFHSRRSSIAVFTENEVGVSFSLWEQAFHISMRWNFCHQHLSKPIEK